MIVTLIAVVCSSLASGSRKPLRFGSQNPLRFDYATLLPGSGSGVAVADLTGDGRKDVAYVGSYSDCNSCLFVLV